MMSSKSDLEIFVDRLFAHHRKTKAVIDLRNEILSNLEAKVTDYLNSGMEYQHAVSLAIQDIEAIDNLIDNNQRVYVNQFWYDMIQSALLYVLIAWILTIPLRLTPMGMMVNNFLILIIVLTGIFFFYFRKQKDEQRTAIINTLSLQRLNRGAWIIWGLFAIVVTAFTVMTHIGSDLYFGRSIQIDGPYALYIIILEVIIPLITVIIPLLFYKADRLIRKYEVYDHE